MPVANAAADMITTLKPMKYGQRSASGTSGNRRRPSVHAVTATKCAPSSSLPVPTPGPRSIGRIDTTIGRNRIDDRLTATATAGSAAPAAIDPNSSTCAGPAQISTVERTPAHIG
jgi:hypothetical protein